MTREPSGIDERIIEVMATNRQDQGHDRRPPGPADDGARERRARFRVIDGERGWIRGDAVGLLANPDRS